MNLSLYENASALRGLEQYQNIIANNIAASHVAGFKKVAVSFEAIEGGEIARSTHDRLKNEMPGSFPVMKNQVDYHEGEMKETGNPMDMSLRGEGFFALLNQNGESTYTRDGQFYVNAQGIMVNSMGHEFSDEGGANIQTIPGGGSDGEIRFIHKDKITSVYTTDSSGKLTITQHTGTTYGGDDKTSTKLIETGNLLIRTPNDCGGN